jgi:hypothetical protein
MLLGASILRAATGAACSAPQYSYTIDEFGPTSSDVELNTPLLLTVGQTSNVTDQGLDPVLELQAVGSDTKVVLKPKYLGGLPGVLSFVPQTPLEPSTTYQLGARLHTGVETSASALASWELTTGTQTRSSLWLDGNLQVTFEEGLDGTFDCDSTFGICGPLCLEVGKVAVTKARISLPAVRGGFAAEYLAGSVSISSATSSGDDGALKIEHVPGLEAGEPAELLVTMPLIADRPYRPCFTFEISDARYDTLRSTPFCLEEPFPEPSKQTDEPEPEPEPNDLPDDTVGPNDPPGEDASDTELAADNERASRRTSTGCSTSGGSHGFGSTLGLLIGLLAFSRRRPLKTAP